jgi:hypothetical protein
MLVGDQQKASLVEAHEPLPIARRIIEKLKLDRRNIPEADSRIPVLEGYEPLDGLRRGMGWAFLELLVQGVWGWLQLTSIAGIEVIDRPEVSVAIQRGGVGDTILNVEEGCGRQGG